MKKHSSLANILCASALSLTASLSACAADDGPADGRTDSFGGANAKADSEFSACQLSEVLNFVNESKTGVNRLTRAGMSRKVAGNIVAHRAGPDGDVGTGDDDLYDDLDELDRVDFVGPVVLDHIVAAILKRCEVDLATRPFINAKTFEGSTGGGYGRDAVELEAAMTVKGVSGAKLHEILLGKDKQGRSIFSRIAKARIMEAFTYAFDINEMPWDSKSHQAREGLAYLPLSIENDRYQPDEGGGARELRLGTDIMDDIYFDSFDYRLTRSDQLLRSRIRWDTADSVRRLLIAAKFGAFVDDSGLKRASKVDVRTSGGSKKDTIAHDIMRGKVNWERPNTPLQPVKEIYDRLNESGRLPDIGSEKDVLVLDPKVHLRSTRSRFHLNLVSIRDMRDFYRNGRQRVRDIRDSAQSALDSGLVISSKVADVEALIAMANGIDDGSLVTDRARDRLLAIDPGMDVTTANLTFPDALSSSVISLDDLDKNRAIAETTSEVLHDFGDFTDTLDREISGTRNLDFDEYVAMFTEWQKSLVPSLQKKRTSHAFLAKWQQIENDSAKADVLAAFNSYGDAQLTAENKVFKKFVPVTAPIWAALGKHLNFATIKINQRQAEAAGSMGLGLWFDQARATYVSASTRPYGNFMIDTMDMAEMLTREEWIGMSDAEKKIDVPFDPAKVFHTVLVNEVQIELGNEKAYINQIANLQAKVDNGSASESEAKRLDGTRFVLGEMSDSLIYLSDLKKAKLLDRLEKNGASKKARWVPSEASKGTMALRRLGDMD